MIALSPFDEVDLEIEQVLLKWNQAIWNHRIVIPRIFLLEIHFDEWADIQIFIHLNYGAHVEKLQNCLQSKWIYFGDFVLSYFHFYVFVHLALLAPWIATQIYIYERKNCFYSDFKKMCTIRNEPKRVPRVPLATESRYSLYALQIHTQNWKLFK